MGVLKIVLTVIFVILSVVLSAIVLLQEGKQAGLGTIQGAAESYYGKNKGRTMEGKLELGTKIVAVLFFVIAVLLNLNIYG
ncbi:MAG: preprotein translocase subunit SecG [Lachnospiraceae bacterium]|nr:preprotein translocase subunit SecG [Lachnospiraceae bacterium]